MSTKREPLLSDADISKMSVTENGLAGENKYRMGRRIRDIYEAARAKDAELIQALVDCIRHNYHLDPFDTIKSAKYYALGGKTQHDALAAAAEAGFKPTEP